MTLYTIVPEEYIFPGHPEAHANIHFLNFDGIPIIAEQSDHYSFRVERIVSTDPAHFLVEGIEPGSILSVKQSFLN
ncbi:YlzJ-like family protein [Peribacillus loiseleuriae]|uniref:YlzJ-like family protein n=1 Tax=Peribacillus loiseleuriae TaxID=1679170 RepID=UPI003D04A226